MVPLDYDKPKGKQITLALTRLPASDPGRQIGSLFINPGGPGGSGVDFVLGAGPFLYSDEVRARFDLVGFDPRGHHRQHPAALLRHARRGPGRLLTPFPFPVTREEERIWIRSDRAVARACAEHGGSILNHMSTANVARDLDLLRRAVGDAKLTYAGYSYGSYLGADLRQPVPGQGPGPGRGRRPRPGRLVHRPRRPGPHAAVLDPAAQRQGRVPVPAGVPPAVRRWRPQLRLLRGQPRRRFDRLAKRLLREPVEFPDGEGGTFLVTYAELIGTTLGVMYDPVSWPDWAEVLQQV